MRADLGVLLVVDRSGEVTPFTSRREAGRQMEAVDVLADEYVHGTEPPTVRATGPTP